VSQPGSLILQSSGILVATPAIGEPPKGVSFRAFRFSPSRVRTRRVQTINRAFYKRILAILREKVRRKRPVTWISKSWFLHHVSAFHTWIIGIWKWRITWWHFTQNIHPTWSSVIFFFFYRFRVFRPIDDHTQSWRVEITKRDDDRYFPYPRRAISNKGTFRGPLEVSLLPDAPVSSVILFLPGTFARESIRLPRTRS